MVYNQIVTWTAFAILAMFTSIAVWEFSPSEQLGTLLVIFVHVSGGPVRGSYNVSGTFV